MWSSALRQAASRTGLDAFFETVGEEVEKLEETKETKKTKEKEQKNDKEQDDQNQNGDNKNSSNGEYMIRIWRGAGEISQDLEVRKEGLEGASYSAICSDLGNECGNVGMSQKCRSYDVGIVTR